MWKCVSLGSYCNKMPDCLTVWNKAWMKHLHGSPRSQGFGVLSWSPQWSCHCYSQHCQASGHLHLPGVGSMTAWTMNQRQCLRLRPGSGSHPYFIHSLGAVTSVIKHREAEAMSRCDSTLQRLKWTSPFLDKLAGCSLTWSQSVKGILKTFLPNYQK